MEKVSETRKVLNEKYGRFQSSLCRSFVKYPRSHCAFQWFIILSISALIGAGGYFVFSDLGLTDFIIIDEQDTQNFLAFDGAIDQAEDANQDLDIATNFRSEPLFPLSFGFLFDTSNGPLFTPETVKEICIVEEFVVAQTRFPEYCLTQNPEGVNTLCDPLGETLSLSFYFYNGEPPGCNKTLTEQDIIDVLAGIPIEAKEFLLNDIDNPTIARSLINLAGPLGADSAPNKNFSDVFESFNDEEVVDGYQLLVEDFVDDIFNFYGVEDRPLRDGFFTNFFQRSGSTLRVQTGSQLLDFVGFQSFITTDQILSAGSYFVVLVFMCFYMRGAFLPFVSMLAIALSLMVGLFLFAIILQIDYFTPLNILVLFLIAGVGADNVFVLFDAWRQSEEEVKTMSLDVKDNEFLEGLEDYQKVLFLRLNYAYGRATLSVSHTAMTTFIAFIATVSSPINAIAGLGLYGALVIITNLWYMFTVHPANLIFYHYVFVLRCGKTLPEDGAIEEKQNKVEIELEDGEVKLGFIARGIEVYIRLINGIVFPYASLLLMAVLFTVMLSSTVKLETPSALESNFPEGHMFADFAIDFNNLFTAGTPESFTEVDAVFGILDLDLGSIRRFSSDDTIGEPVFDPNFEMFSQESQAFILEICDEVVTLPCEETGCTQDFLVLNGTVECILKDFKTFLELSGSAFTETFVDPDTTGAFPSNELFIANMEGFLQSQLGNQFADSIGIFGDEVRFVSLNYRMTMIQDQPLKIKEPVIELFDEYTASVRSRAPSQLQSFYQTSFDHVWQHTESAFVTGLFTGLFISLTASFFVLLIGTKNPRVAFFAIAGVAGVVSSVLGSARFIGFDLGTAESVAGVFVIGLAVDYIVHLGHMFMHSREFLEGEENTKINATDIFHKIFGQTGERSYSNKEMLEFSVRKMGPTVLAGALTTFGSAAFLSLCTFSFFRKMSVLLMFTILYSVAFAFFYFVPVLRLFGPGTR